MTLLSRLSLPLLTKELAEQSARRRTYIVRALYAGLLYGAVLTFFAWDAGSVTTLGRGGQLFAGVLVFQFAAVFALLPMLTAGVLTAEKERDTLGLLLITRLGAWTIVLEKYFSRVIPMLLYQLMSLPLLAVAYSLGGVDHGAVLRAAVALTTCVLQVGALAVFCSTWCRTTTQALILTYLLLPLHPMNWAMLEVVTGPFRGQSPHANVTGSTILSLVCTGLTLVMATAALWPRAFLRPKERLLKLLRAIDACMTQVNNNRFTKGIVLVRDDQTLPFDRPIAWRETSRRAFGTTRYLVRLLIVIEAPLLVWLIGPMTDQVAWQHYRWPPGYIEQWVLWWLGTLLIIAQSTSLIAAERSRQTLDVLLSTPLSPRDIVRQKFAGIWRLMLVLAIPFTTAVIMRAWFGIHVSSMGEHTRVGVVLQAAVAVLVYWPLIAVIGFQMSLWCRSQLQAMTATLVLVLLAVAAPWAANRLFPVSLQFVRRDYGLIVAPLAFLTVPSGPVARHELSEYELGQFFVACTHLAVYLGVLLLLWRRTPGDFIRAVRRCERPA